MKHILTLLITVQILSYCSFAQVNQEWAQRYNGPVDSTDMGSSVVTDASGNIYVTGASRGPASGFDYATVKYNPAGVQQWVQRYNGPSNSVDYAIAIAVDGSGNVYVTGYSGTGSNLDYATLKYNSSGVQQWVQRYNGPNNTEERPTALLVDAAGNVYVTGYSVGTGTNTDYATIKYNTSGLEQWVQRYNGTGNNIDRANGIAVDGAGNVYVTGYSTSTGTSLDCITIKYNSNGIQQWLQRFTSPGSSSDFGEAIALDAIGNIYVTGAATISTAVDYLTIKYNNAGDTNWVRKYNGPANNLDHAYELAVFDEDNIYVSGLSFGNSEDWATVKYNSAGVQQWAQRYDGSGGDMPGIQEDLVSGIALDAAGNLYVTGTVYMTGTFHDYGTIKYNSSGVQQWIQFYNGADNNDDGALSIDVDNTGVVYVTGYNELNTFNTDFLTIKYSQSIGIQNISGEIPKQFSLSQNYPNPFNPVTNVKFQIPNPGFVKLTVFDLLGREVETLVSVQLKAGTYEADWNASSYSSGVFFYRIAIHSDKLEAEGFTETKKMILIK